MLSPRGKANMTPSSQIMLADESSVSCCTGCKRSLTLLSKSITVDHAVMSFVDNVVQKRH